MPASVHDLHNDSVSRLLLFLSFPTIVATSINALFNFVDRYFLAFLGELEFAAVGVAFIVQMLMSAIALGVGTGFTVLLGQAIGRGDRRRQRDYLYLAAAAVVILSLTSAAVGFWWTQELASLLGVSGEMSIHFGGYLRVVMMGSFGIYLPIILNSLARAQGEMIKPMKVMMVGALLNIALDPLFIFGGMGVPAYGVEGAAYATVVARSISTVYAFFVFRGFLRSILLGCSASLRSGIRTALSVENQLKVTRYSVLSVAMNCMPPILFSSLIILFQPYGDLAKAAFTLAMSCGVIVLFPVVGLSRSVITLTAQNAATKNFQRCREIERKALVLGLLVTTILSLLLVACSKALVEFFMDGQHESAKFLLYCYVFSLPFQALIQVKESYLQGFGRLGVALLIRVSFVVIVLFCWGLGGYYGFQGVALGISLGFLVQALWSSLLVKRVKSTPSIRE